MYDNVATENVTTKVRKIHNNVQSAPMRMTVDYESDKLDDPASVGVMIVTKQPESPIAKLMSKVPLLPTPPDDMVYVAARNMESGEHSMLQIPHPDEDSSDLDTKDWVGSVLKPVAHGSSRVRRANPGMAKAVFGGRFVGDDDATGDGY